MLRSEAAQQQQLRGLRSIRLQELVTDLDAEAATWRLLFTLHGIPEMGFPAGAGGPPLHGCGSAQRTSQRIASIVEADPELNRQALDPLTLGSAYSSQCTSSTNSRLASTKSC